MQSSRQQENEARTSFYENTSLHLMSNLFSLITKMEDDAIVFKSIVMSISHTVRFQLRGYRDFSRGKDVPHLHKFKDIMKPEVSKFWTTIMLLMDLKNILIRLTKRNIFTQMMGGHPDIRAMFWNLESFNQMVRGKASLVKEEVKEEYDFAYFKQPPPMITFEGDNIECVFDKSVMNRILNYCFPESLKNPRKYFYFEKEGDKDREKHNQHKFQNLVKRYDGDSEKAKAMLEEVQGDVYAMVKSIAHKCIKEFDYQYIYMGEQTAVTERKHKMMAWHFQYQQILEIKRIKKMEQAHFLDFLWHIGMFAIGYPYLPSIEHCQYVDERSVWQRELEKLKFLKQRKIEDYQFIRRNQKEKALEKGLIMQFVVVVKGTSYLRQVGDLARQEPYVTQIENLPFFIGDKTPFWDFIDVPFYNALDGSVNGMSLVIELLQQKWQTDTTRQQVIVSKDAFQEWELKRSSFGFNVDYQPEGMGLNNYDQRGIDRTVYSAMKKKLVITNYSCNGYSLRMKLEEGRKWLVSQKLVVEIDPPFEKREAHISSQDYDHFIFEISFGFREMTGVQKRETEIEKARAALEQNYYAESTCEAAFDDLEITVRQFKTKEVVTQFMKEGSFDAVRVEVVKLADDKFELCISNKYPESENVWVWARDVVDRIDLRYSSDLKECPIEYFATYFAIDMQPTHESNPTRKIKRGDLLSFGRQKFYLQ